MADLQQALPTQFTDLGSLWQNAPALAAMQTGDQMRMAQQNNQSLQDAFALQEQHKAAMRPGELGMQWADINYKNSHSRYNNALSGKAELETDESRQTMPGRVSATNAENRAKVGKAELDMVDQAGQKFQYAGAAVASEPTPWGKVQKAKEILKGILPDSPEVDQFLMKNAQNLHTYLSDYGRNMYEASRAKQAADTKGEWDLKGHELAADATKLAATEATKREQMGIDAGKYGKNTTDYSMSKSLTGNLEQQYGAAQEMARKAQDPEQQQYWLQRAQTIAAQIIAAKKAAVAEANTIKIDPNNPQILNMPNPPGATAPQVPSPPGATPRSPDVPPDLPQGTKSLGNGMWQLPDGTRIRKKKQ